MNDQQKEAEIESKSIELARKWPYSAAKLKTVVRMTQGSKKAAEIILAGASCLNIGPTEAAEILWYCFGRNDEESDPLIVSDAGALPALLGLCNEASKLLQNGGPENETNLEVCRHRMLQVGQSLAVRLAQATSKKA